MNSERDCIFCQIIRDEEPASVIYEDDLIMALMTIHPTRPGEFMVIPKDHIDHFTDLPDELMCHLMIHAQRLSQNLRKHFKPLRVGLVVHGFGVPHAHMIVVPQHTPNDIISGRHVLLKNGEIKFSYKHLPTPSREVLDQQAQN